MNHLIFALYLLAILLGVVISVRLLSKRESYLGLGHALVVNWLLAAFTAWGALVLYASANLTLNIDLHTSFLFGAGLIMSGLSVMLPKQIEAMLVVSHSKQSLFNRVALAAAISSFGIPLAGTVLQFLLFSVPVLSIIGAAIYSHFMHRQYHKLISIPVTTRWLSVLLPPCYIAIGLLEGLTMGEQIAQRGVTLSLPIIYIAASIVLWCTFSDSFPSARQVNTRELVRPAALTDKEFEIALAVHRGLSNKQIADELNISPSTVKNHLYTIYKKMAVSNRVALLRQLDAPHL